MIKIWFNLISAVLLIALLNLLFAFDFANLLHWIYLVGLVAAVSLTVLIYLEQPHKKEAAVLKKTYSDFIKEKDSRIDKLKEETDIMFKTAMKKAEKDLELEELKKKLEEQTK